MSVPQAEFVPLQLEAPGTAPGPTEIQIEVRRGAATVTFAGHFPPQPIAPPGCKGGSDDPHRGDLAGD
jgi:hypothetical protein